MHTSFCHGCDAFKDSQRHRPPSFCLELRIATLTTNCSCNMITSGKIEMLAFNVSMRNLPDLWTPCLDHDTAKIHCQHHSKIIACNFISLAELEYWCLDGIRYSVTLCCILTLAELEYWCFYGIRYSVTLCCILALAELEYWWLDGIRYSVTIWSKRAILECEYWCLETIWCLITLSSQIADVRV